MGAIIETTKELIPCVESDREKEEKKNVKELDEAIKDSDIKLDNEFYCTCCEETPPHITELLSIHSDNDKVEFICPKKEEWKEFKLKEYCEENSKKIKCSECESDKNSEVNIITDNEINEDKYRYCTRDKKFYCDRCFILNHSPNEKNDHSDYKVKELSSMCTIHNKMTDKCCRECRMNVCSICFDLYHNRHIKGNHNSSKDILEARAEVLKKAKNLNLMKKFYEMILSAYESNNENTIYQKNVVNVANCIEKEKNRDKFERDLAIYKIMKSKKN